LAIFPELYAIGLEMFVSFIDKEMSPFFYNKLNKILIANFFLFFPLTVDDFRLIIVFLNKS